MQLSRNKHCGILICRMCAPVSGRWLCPPAAPMLGNCQALRHCRQAARDRMQMENRPSKLRIRGPAGLRPRRTVRPSNAQLPLPPMLMFDRISEIAETGGEYGKGLIRAELELKPDLWFFPCHFKGDPVMPGCLGLDALWQMLGFFLGWLGAPGKGRALGLGEVKFSGQVLPTVKKVVYGIDIKRVMRSQAGARHRRRLAVGGRLDHLPGDRPQGRPVQATRAGAAAERRIARPMRPIDVADASSRCGRGSHEAGRRHRDGHRLIHRQQHPGSAGEPARGQVRHLARRQIRRARLPLPGARRADARSGRGRSIAARCASSAAARRGTTSPWSRRSATPGSRTSDISNERTGIIMGSGGPSTRAIVEAADITAQARARSASGRSRCRRRCRRPPRRRSPPGSRSRA